MSDIFISYKREDKETARELARLFQQANWTVWWDRDLLAGDTYEKVIRRELAEARAVVVVWSRAAVDPADDNTWVKGEAKSGKRRGVLVPILIDHIDPADIPFEFGDIHTPDLSDWDGSPSHEEVEGLLRRVAELVNRPPAELRPSPWQRLAYFYRRRRAAVLVLAALALVAPLVLFAGQRLSASSKRREAVRLMAEGTKAAGESNYEGAIGLYNEALRHHDAFADVYYHRAQSYVGAGEEELALADFKRALALKLGDPWRRKADAYIAKLQKGAIPASTPPQGGTGGSADFKAQAGMPSPYELAGGDDVPLREQVELMFSDDKETRIEATTKLVIERKKDPRVITLALDAAALRPKNLHGVVNTLVLLENADPAILKEKRDQVLGLLDLVKGNGDITARHAGNVRRILDR